MINPRVIRTGLHNLPEGSIVLIEANGEDATEVNVEVVRFLAGEGYSIILVSAGRPYTNLLRVYNEKKVDVSKIFFIDCLSKHTIKTEDSANVAFMDDVSDLTSISIAVSEAARTLPNKKFLLIDSLSSMLIYNDPAVYTRFIHSTITKLRVSQVSCGLLSYNAESDREVKKEVAMFCDKTVKLNQ
ncbi:Uncharacterised protein [uncultured archaeon]|nr:Uncharacterised protein [uncultured archaeon]